MTKAEKAAYDREYRAKNKARFAEAKRVYVAANFEREQARVAAWHAANAERVAEIKRGWRQRNPGADRQYVEANRISVDASRAKRRASQRALLAAKQREYGQRPDVKIARAAYAARYRKAHPEVHRRSTWARRKRVAQATPPWADKAAMLAIYDLARSVDMHVDHVIPLKGANVCGLHVETNLSVLPPLLNRMKGARHAD